MGISPFTQHYTKQKYEILAKETKNRIKNKNMNSQKLEGKK